MIFILSIILIFYCFLFLLFNIMFFLTKKHFLKLHFYAFRRIKLLYNLIYLIQSKDYDFKYHYHKVYIYFFYFRNYSLTIGMFLLFIYCVILNNGDLEIVLLFLPYYSLYIFILSIFNFIVIKLKIDFEILIMESYYRNEISFLMERDEMKKLEYKKYLLSNFSKYKFEDCILLFDSKKLKYNSLVVQTNRYTKNEFPNDFFSKIEKIKPKFLKK